MAQGSEIPERIEARLRQWEADGFVRRMLEHDPTLWAARGTPEIEDRLGWLDLPTTMAGKADDLNAIWARGCGGGRSRCGRDGHGRVEPRAGGLSDDVRQRAGLPASLSAGQHAPGRGDGAGGEVGTRANDFRRFEQGQARRPRCCRSSITFGRS